jgi:hypothetical protein
MLALWIVKNLQQEIDWQVNGIPLLEYRTEKKKLGEATPEEIDWEAVELAMKLTKQTRRDLGNQANIGIRSDGENDGQEERMGRRQIMPEVQRTRRGHDARAPMPKPLSYRHVGGSLQYAQRMDGRDRQ